MAYRHGNYKPTDLDDDIEVFKELATLNGLPEPINNILRALPAQLGATYRALEYRDKLLLELMVARKLIAPKLGVLLHRSDETLALFDRLVNKRKARLHEMYETESTDTND